MIRKIESAARTGTERDRGKFQPRRRWPQALDYNYGPPAREVTKRIPTAYAHTKTLIRRPRTLSPSREHADGCFGRTTQPRPKKNKFAGVKSRWHEHFEPSGLEEGEVIVLRKTRLCYHEGVNVTHRCDHSFQVAHEVRKLQAEHARLMRLERLLHIGDNRTRSQWQREYQAREKSIIEAEKSIQESERYLSALDQLEDPMTAERERVIWRIDVATRRLGIARRMDEMDVESSMEADRAQFIDDPRIIVVDTKNGFDRLWGNRRTNADTRINHVMPLPRDIAKLFKKESLESRKSESERRVELRKGDSQEGDSLEGESRKGATVTNRLDTIVSENIRSDTGSAGEAESYHSRGANRSFHSASWFSDLREEKGERTAQIARLVAHPEHEPARNEGSAAVRKERELPGKFRKERELRKERKVSNAEAAAGRKEHERAVSNGEAAAGRKEHEKVSNAEAAAGRKEHERAVSKAEAAARRKEHEKVSNAEAAAGRKEHESGEKNVAASTGRKEHENAENNVAASGKNRVGPFARRKKEREVEGSRVASSGFNPHRPLPSTKSHREDVSMGLKLRDTHDMNGQHAHPSLASSLRENRLPDDVVANERTDRSESNSVALLHEMLMADVPTTPQSFEFSDVSSDKA